MIIARESRRRQQASLAVMGMLLWGSGFLSVGAGMTVADSIALRHAYGGERVRREGLRIVDYKPTLTVSNGDRIPAEATRHFLIILAAFMAGTPLTFVAAQAAMPRTERSAEDGKIDSAAATSAADAAGACAGLMLVFGLAIVSNILIAGAASVACAVLAAWVRHGLRVANVP